MKKYIYSILFLLLATISFSQTLSSSEEQHLLYMLEEEKLARDVYTQLNTTWNQNPFTNIINSEQSHIDAVANLLTQNGTSYSILPAGVYNNSTLQNLYNQLVTQGQASLVGAFTVGMTIEDVDIYDLQEYKTQTTNTSILAVYDWLICGSKNHMRAFKNKLYQQGGTYSPQFITVEEYNSIIAGTNSTCTLSNEDFELNLASIISNTIVIDSFQILLEGNSTVKIFSLEGKLLKSSDVVANERITISDYSTGVYLLTIQNKTNNFSIKIIKK